MKSLLDIHEQRKLKVAFGMQVEEENGNHGEDFARQVEIIFEGRARDMRWWNILVLVSNVFH
jgi:hypothetical protein